MLLLKSAGATQVTIPVNAHFTIGTTGDLPHLLRFSPQYHFLMFPEDSHRCHCCGLLFLVKHRCLVGWPVSAFFWATGPWPSDVSPSRSLGLVLRLVLLVLQSWCTGLWTSSWCFWAALMHSLICAYSAWLLWWLRAKRPCGGEGDNHLAVWGFCALRLTST